MTKKIVLIALLLTALSDPYTLRGGCETACVHGVKFGLTVTQVVIAGFGLILSVFGAGQIIYECINNGDCDSCIIASRRIRAYLSMPVGAVDNEV